MHRLALGILVALGVFLARLVCTGDGAVNVIINEDVALAVDRRALVARSCVLPPAPRGGKSE